MLASSSFLWIMGRLHEQLLLDQGHILSSLWRLHPQSSRVWKKTQDYILSVGLHNSAGAGIPFLFPDRFLEIPQREVCRLFKIPTSRVDHWYIIFDQNIVFKDYGSYNSSWRILFLTTQWPSISQVGMEVRNPIPERPFVLKTAWNWTQIN